MADDLTETIVEKAADASSVSVDGLTTTERSLSELIAADKYLKSQQATKSPKRGLRFTKLSPPGTC